MFLPMPIHHFYFHADLIWLDGPFKKQYAHSLGSQTCSNHQESGEVALPWVVSRVSEAETRRYRPQRRASPSPLTAAGLRPRQFTDPWSDTM
jgi:hypothetical protein